MLKDLPELINLQKAAQLTGLPEEMLTRMAQTGRIRAVRFNGEVLISMRQVRKVKQASADEKARPGIDRGQFRDLDGTPIGISQAARKYNLPVGSISNWARKGYIRILGKDEHHKQRVFVNEADVAYIKELISELGGPRHGRDISHYIA